MPKRKDIKSILILGAGPIIIGQACEFDYSGTQACKALKEEGYRVILVNSNPATIMTDPNIADATYIEPIQCKIIYNIIKKERPDALLPTMGGQIALNIALELEYKGILKEFNIEIIGVNISAIHKSENRDNFNKIIKKIGLESARSGIAHTLEESLHVVLNIGFPCIIRPSFTMGGTGGGIAHNIEEFKIICSKGLTLSPTQELLIDESLIGWKEYEMELIRDKKDNCIVVCSIENFDPMGIHTGDSITVAPAQTLTDKEYQIMRNASISILREVGIDNGGANVQFAVNPINGKLVVIEMNPRVSRSSALASKATGFPIAKIATKLAIGYTLDELLNDITKCTPASFEPSIDYIVTKIPRFNFNKFPEVNDRLTTQMKSVGEIMAIGRTQQESLQKALCSLEENINGFDSMINYSDVNYLNKIHYELKNAGSKRILYIADAFRLGLSTNEIFNLTHIDKWFLSQIKELVEIENNLKEKQLSLLDNDYIFFLKQKGFSDARIAFLIGVKEEDIRQLRYKYNLHPVYKRVDTCAAEFNTETAYMYSTYESECESRPSNKKKIVILGSGPNRIGQGIEFDYCCVHAALSLHEEGYETIMINCNPETVSTDYDISDRLYFEPLTLEHILEVINVENPEGVIVQFGGQTPLKLAHTLNNLNIPIIGTNPYFINQAENREKFKEIIKKINLTQPKNDIAFNVSMALNKAKIIGYPIVIRPSYVLGGQSMEIIYNDNDLISYFKEKQISTNDFPILLDKFLEDATEIDVDAICDGKDVFIGGIMEHIEQAGIHSGDSACSLPAYNINEDIQNLIRKQVKKIALALNVIGLINIQFAVKNEIIYLIEVNPRAARTVPFVSKAIGISLAKIATKVMVGKTLSQQKMLNEIKSSFYFVKEAILPFNKFPNIDPILGPEMRSTGEVMGIGKNFAEAFAKVMLSSESNIKKGGRVLLSVCQQDKGKILNLAIGLIKYGFKLDATYGTAKILQKSGITVRIVNKICENKPNIEDFIKNKEYTYILNTAFGRKSIQDSKLIRSYALQYKIYYNTTLNGGLATLMSLESNVTNNIISIQEIHMQSKY